MKENTHIPNVVAGNWFSNVLEQDYRYIRTKMWCLMPHELTIQSAESTKCWIWHALTLTCSRRYTHFTSHQCSVFTILDNRYWWCECSRLVGLFCVLDSISESIFRLPFSRRLSGNMGSRTDDENIANILRIYEYIHNTYALISEGFVIFDYLSLSIFLAIFFLQYGTISFSCIYSTFSTSGLDRRSAS